MLRFRWLVLAGWLVVLAGGVFASTRLPAHLANSFAVPGTDSQRAEAVLARDFGERPGGDVHGRLPRPALVGQGAAGAAPRAARARGARPSRRTSRHVPRRRRRRLRRARDEPEPAAAKAYTEPLRPRRSGPARSSPASRRSSTTSTRSSPPTCDAARRSRCRSRCSSSRSSSASRSRSRFRSSFAACTIAGTLAVLYGVAHLVLRHVLRDEPRRADRARARRRLLAADRLPLPRGAREDGRAARPGDRARRWRARAAPSSSRASPSRSASHSCCSCRSRSSGRWAWPACLIPLVSIAAALTLQPALLSFFGRRALTGVRLPRPTRRRREPWAALARTIMRRPLLVLVPTAAVLLAAAAPVLFLQLSPGSLASLPRTTESARGLAALAQRVRARRADADADRRRRRRARRRAAAGGARRRDASRGQAVPRPGGRTSSRAAASSRTSRRSGRYARVVVVGRHEYGAPASRRLVDRLRGDARPGRALPGRHAGLAGGARAEGRRLPRARVRLLPVARAARAAR